MLDVLFVIFFITFPILLYVLMKYTGFKLMRISLVSFVIAANFILAYVGILPIYFGWNEYYYVIGVQDKNIILCMFALSSWSLIALLLGAVFTSKLFFTKRHADNICICRCLKNNEIFLLFLVFLICLAVLILYINAVPRVALAVAVLDGSQEAKLSRSLMGNDFSGKVHWYNYFMRHVLDFVTFSFFANWLIKKNKVTFFMFATSFLAAVVSAVIATEKAPIAWLLIGLFLVYTIVRHAGVYSLKEFLKFMPVVIGILICLYIFFMGSQSVALAFSSLLGRVFVGGIVPAYFYLDFFPKHHDFLWGLSFPSPGGLLFHEPYRLTVEIMNWISPVVGDVVGSAPTVYWGEMYANFGVIGVFVSPFVVGAGLCIFDNLLARLEDTPIKIGLVVWLLLHYKNLSESGLFSFVVDFYLLIVLMVVFIVILIANNGKILFKKAPKLI